MQSKTRTKLTIGWVVVLFCMVLPWILARVVNIAPLASVAWFFALALAFITLRRCERGQHLQRPGWYRAALILQLVVAVAGVMAAAHTVMSHGAIGLVSIATVQLGVVILSWRAITMPDPRRAVISGMVSGFVTFVALLVDIALDIHTMSATGHTGVVTDMWSAFAVVGVMASWFTGGLVCLAAIRTFGETTNLPDARAVD